MAWICVAGALALLVPAGDATLGESAELLPPTTPVHRGIEELAKHFGDKSALSSVVVVFERSDSALSAKDLADIESVAKQIAKPAGNPAFPDEMRSVSIRTPAAFALAGKGNPLISEDGRAALIWVSLPYNYITKSAARVAGYVQGVMADFKTPAGMKTAVTGSAGYGYDYAVAIERSHTKTSIVTFISVTLILLLVYRAPVAAILPLLGISIAAVVTFKILALAEGHGVHSGTAEQIFTFVLLYGAGVDYSLLFMGRYREFLDQGHASGEAVVLAQKASLPAIASSAIITMAGLMALCFAQFSVYRNAGPAVVLAIFIAGLAAITLVPAILGIVGPVTFWPTKSGQRQSILWPAVSRLVAARPWAVLLVTTTALIVPAVAGAQIKWNYDALFSLKPSYLARQGTEIVERHWPTGEIAPINIVAVSDRRLTDSDWKIASAKLVDVIRRMPDIDNVRALSLPLGVHVPPATNAGVLLLAGSRIHDEFVSPDGQAMRLSAVLNISPLTRVAMDDATHLQKAADDLHLNLQFHLTGATAEMIDLRDLTQRDFHMVALIGLSAILIVVWAVLRDLFVSALILFATVLSYLTTLGLTEWCFQLLGNHGLEWKVQMLLFMVLIAVGQDYSIFFAIRLAQEARRLPCKDATTKALVFTGPVISSCGLIMAATLGSVMAGDVRLMVQLGFAFALGMLIDTFAVRPLILPSVILITGRTLQRSPTWGHEVEIGGSGQEYSC